MCVLANTGTLQESGEAGVDRTEIGSVQRPPDIFVLTD